MPWSKKQVRTAQAVEHGWKPKGSAKGFDDDFARKVVAESKLGKGAKPAPKKGR